MEILVRKSVAAHKVTDILSRYGKEAKRLHVDLKHDRERKILDIRQRLESELIDEISDDVDWNAVNQLIESTVPSVIRTGGLINLAHPAGNQSNTNITVNYNPQFVGNVNGVIAQEINGNQHLGAQGKEPYAPT